MYKIFHPIKNLYLRLTRGAGCCDVYNLDCYLVERILKPLKVFRAEVCSYPSNVESLREWKKILDQIIWSFENYEKDDVDNERLQEGLELFGKYFQSLWK